MKLTQSQVIFLKMVKSGTAPRSLSNKTARALNKQGLIKPSAMFGWYLTTEGLVQLNELIGANNETN